MPVIRLQGIGLLLPVLALQACFDVNHVDPGAAPPIAPPRLIAPLSTATVTSWRPRLRWALPSGADGARVQICRDRACTDIVAEFDAVGPGGAPAVNLPQGVLFWRAYGRGGAATGQDPSPTWQFTVGARSAPVDTAWGATPDVNGDGLADFIVGGGFGLSYVYLGGAIGLSTTPSATVGASSALSLGDVNGDGFADILADDAVYLGSATGLSPTASAFLVFRAQYVYSAIASAGDVNGDGYADVVTATIGSLYIYLGSAAGLPFTPSATVSTPESDGSFYPSSLAGVGDVNGDGFADIVFVASNVDTGAAKVYVYQGSPAGLPSATFALPVILPGIENRADAVASAGDVNGDGYADVIIGSTSANLAAPDPGGAFVYLGGASGLSTTPSARLPRVSAGVLEFGASVASAGDVNGDGFADVIVGATDVLSVGSTSASWRAYVYLGSATGIPATPSGTLTPKYMDGNFGLSLAGARDVNGDGYADVVAGSPVTLADIGIGSVYVYFGGAMGLPAVPSVTLTAPDDPNGPDLYFGGPVASARDVDAGPMARGLIRQCPG